MDMNLLTGILVLGAAVFFAAWLVLRFGWWFGRLSDAFLRLPAGQKVALVLAVGVATVSAQKSGTNDVERVGGSNAVNRVAEKTRRPAPVRREVPQVAVSPEDVARGYRLESVSVNPDVSYAMPDDAALAGTWHLTGAFEDGVMSVLEKVMSLMEGLLSRQLKSCRLIQKEIVK